MSEILKKIDEFDNIHYIEKENELGRGGQGVVYKTKNADTVIKIALENEEPIKDKQKIKLFHHKVKKLIYKPLPSDINIAKPLVVLKNEAGYVMNLLDGMKPLSTLMPQELSKNKAEQLTIPEFLKDVEKQDKRSAIYFTYYLNSGGLRKRLYTLSRLAIILYRLHSRGILYFDISHNNIFINSDDIPLVYLIDADNIEYESVNKNTIFTPNFEVPELAKKNPEPNTTYSDIYAFGILSFLLLTTTHPFDGIGLEEVDWDSEESEQKERWELPWIEDSDDDSNKSDKGLKGTLTITKELYSLFHKLFEEGKENKYQRPTLPIWIENLEKSACRTLLCLNCKMSYYNDLFDKCPYCQTGKSKRLKVDSYILNNDTKQYRWSYIKEIDNNINIIILPCYLFELFDISKIDDTFLQINFVTKTKIELSFEETDKKIYFESKTPIVVLKKRIGLGRLEKGISIIIDSDIKILVEIKIEQ